MAYANQDETKDSTRSPFVYIGLVMIPTQLSIVLLFCIVVSGHMTSSC